MHVFKHFNTQQDYYCGNSMIFFPLCLKICREVSQWCTPKTWATVSPTITARQAHTRAQTKAATAPQVRPAPCSHSPTMTLPQAPLKPVHFSWHFFSYLSGSQTQRSTTQGPKTPKHNVLGWRDALPQAHADACDCDDYSLPKDKR